VPTLKFNNMTDTIRILAGRTLIITGFLTMFSISAFGQRKQVPEKLRQVVEALKQTRTYGYHFVIQADFPNGQKDKLSGEAYMDGANRIMFNKTEAFVMLYSDKWFYRANHHEKTITIVNLDKHYNDVNKISGRNELFGNQMTGEFLDSMIMKYGRVSLLEEQGNIINAVLEFPKSMALNKIELTYNLKEKIPVSMNLYIFYPAEEDPGHGIKRKGISQVIKCSQYKKAIAMKHTDTKTYFLVSDGTVQLKQFNNYKIYSLL